MKLRKLLAVLVSVLMLCSLIPAGALVSVSASAPNLITNGDFETGSFADGWDQSWYAPGIVTDVIHGGTYAMKSTNTASQYQTMIKSKAITVEANTDYTISFWYYYEGASTNGGIYLYVKGNGSTNISYVAPNATEAGVWKQATLTFNTGSYTSITLFFQNKVANTGGTFYIDDVEMPDPNYVEPEPEPEPEPETPAYTNLMVNGDFETGSFNDGWDQSWYAPSIVTSPVHGGTYAMKTTNTANQYQTMIKTKAIALAANTDYTLTFWYYYEGTATNAGAYVFIKGNGSTDIKNVTADGSTAGVWKQASVTFNTGSYTSVTLFFQNKTANAGGSFYFDDVVLYDPNENAEPDPEPEPEPEPDPEPEGPAPVPVVPGNVVVNGDFEIGSTNGWKVYGDTKASAESAYTGLYGAELSSDTSWGSLLYQTVPVEAGEEYVVSFWYKAVTENVNFQIKDGNSSGAVLANDSLGAATWTKMTYRITSEAAALYLNFFHNSSTTKNLVYVDDVQVYPAPIVTNGDFEEGSNRGWTVYNGSAVTAEAKKNGSYGMKLNGTGNWGSMANQNVTVEAGKTYVVSAWIKVIATGTNIKIQDGGSSGATLANGWHDKTEWTRVSYVVSPTTNTLHINFHSSGKAVTETVYIDDVTVTEIADDGLLVNGAFETGSITPWIVYYGSNVSTDATHDGYYGAHLKGDGGWGCMTYQDFTTEAGKKYTFSGYFKTITTGCNIQIVDVATGATIESRWYNATEWTKVAMDFTATGTTTRINICGGGNGNAESVYFDSASVIELKEPTYDGFIYNGDFEAGSLTKWDVYQSTEISADAAYTGSYGAKMIGNGGWGATLNQKFNLEVGKTYKISFWYKAISNGVNYVVKGDVDGKNLASQYISTGNTGAKWVYYEKTFKSAYNTSAELNFSGSGKETTDEVWIDDIKIECLSGDEMDRLDNLDNGGVSVRDTEDDNRGLAFRFFLNVNNAQYEKGNQLIPGTGTLKLFEYGDATATLLETGAVVSNKENANLTLEGVNGGNTIKVVAKYLNDWESDAIGYAVRIINIPDKGVDTEIYARPYYTYEVDGALVTIYGDITSANYANEEAIRRTKRVLTIGDASVYGNMDTYLYDVLKSANYDQVILGNLYGDTYYKNDDNGEWVATAGVDASTAIADERWQYVVVTNADDLAWANANKPFGAEILYYGSDIPADTALANLATVRPNATEAEKEFAITATWYLVLTGESLDLITYQPGEIASCYYDLCRAAAHAVRTPNKVSDLTETVIVAGGDYQMQTQAAGDPDVTPLLDSALSAANNSLFDSFFFIGDYAYSTGHDVATQGTESLDAVVSDYAYGNKVYTEGNHDAPTVDLIAPTGGHDPLGAPYGVFVINENDYSAYGGGSTAVANQLTAYFNEKIGSDTWGNKPIFVLCHVPLHYSRRTIDESCGKNALPIVNALNAAGEAGLNVIFLFGHNHSGDYDAYIGGGSIYLAKGDSILVSDPDSVKNAPSEVELNFTYMNAGYVGYYANHGSEADRTLTMTTFTIREDGSVIISRYDANGLHNLKAKGVLNKLDNDNQYVVAGLDETVYGPQRVVTATSDEEYTG